MFFNKKFDLVISFGEDCACTSYLRRFGLQKYSYPFDWLTKANFETRIKLIINDFDNFLDFSNLYKLEKSKNKLVDNNCDYFADKELDFYFYHDFLNNMSLEENFPKVKDKYNRRISRMYDQINKSKNVLFVWWSRDKHQDVKLIEKSFVDLQNKFYDKNIILLIIEYSENKESILLSDSNILILRYDNISLQNSDWNEIMGNEINNENVFNKIKIVITIKSFFYYFLYKIVKLLINFIPNKEIRQNLRNNIKTKINRAKL